MDKTEIIEPEGYVECECCKAILGYKAHESNVLYLYLYAYPTHIPKDLALRRIIGRTASIELRCSHCGNWQYWSNSVECPWENRVK